MELPKLNRLLVSPNKESEDKEIFYPDWNCFCCHDTGKVQPHWTRLIIPDFDWNKDKIPLCTNCRVHHDLTHLLEYQVFDTRFTSQVCAELDRIARKDWANAAKSKQQKLLAQKFQQAVLDISKKQSLRKRDRTENDNREVQARKAEIEAITHEQWMQMQAAYIGVKKADAAI